MLNLQTWNPDSLLTLLRLSRSSIIAVENFMSMSITSELSKLEYALPNILNDNVSNCMIIFQSSNVDTHGWKISRLREVRTRESDISTISGEKGFFVKLFCLYVVRIGWWCMLQRFDCVRNQVNPTIILAEYSGQVRTIERSNLFKALGPLVKPTRTLTSKLLISLSGFDPS